MSLPPTNGDAPPKKTGPPPLDEVLRKAGERALGGGLPGAAAMGMQVMTLMWLRTTMNYQYRHGGSTRQALSTLYKDGGVRRFYRGLGPALLQGPLSRFGDTAANSGMMVLLDSYDETRDLPTFMKTMCASAAAGAWRMNLMPLDALKTTLQVEGSRGLTVLKRKVATNGAGVLYHGGFAAFGATFAGHFPWFFTFNFLQENLPAAEPGMKTLARNAVSGFCASVVSDTTSNSIRVMKTTKQTSEVALTYLQTFKIVVEKDGLIGLFGRGLKTRILTNGLQGMMFSVLWKEMEKRMNAGKD